MKLTEKQLSEELRAMRLLPEPAFAAALDERASEGFARPDGESPLSRLRERVAAVPFRRLVPALGAAAALVVVTAVAVVELSPSGDTGLSSGGGQPPAVSTEQAPQSAAGAAGQAAAPAKGVAVPEEFPPPPGQDLAPGAQKRAVERTVSLNLSTDPTEVADVADGVVEATDRYHGIVVSSSVRTTGDERSRASFELRIPTPRLQEALSDLSGLAHVSSRNEGSLDITAPTIDARGRAADARAEVDSLLAQLAAAGDPAEATALRAKLRDARAELASARAALNSLNQRAEFTAVSVTVLGDGADQGGWSLGDAVDDAGSVLETAAGIALVSLAILAPLALLSVAAVLGWRVLARRRREAALD
jgi:Domain of unknown function (DUF4349)